jgi:hypothetical protein
MGRQRWSGRTLFGSTRCGVYIFDADAIRSMFEES